MTWARLDDQLHAHPKALAAGLEAMGLWTLALSWCRAYRTGGQVSPEALRRLAGPKAKRLAARLVDARLWKPAGDGWRFHDWAEHYEDAPGADPVQDAPPARPTDPAAARRERNARYRAKVSGRETPETPPASHGASQGASRETPEASQGETGSVSGETPEASHEASRETPPSQTLPSEKEPNPPRAPARPVSFETPEASRETQGETPRPASHETAGDADSASGERVSPLALLPSEPPSQDPVRVVFDHWALMCGKRKPVLDPKRRALIERSLKRHGLAVCLRAVDGVAGSDWHRGGNPSRKEYTDLGLILRDADHIEGFAALADADPGEPPPPAVVARAEAAPPDPDEPPVLDRAAALAEFARTRPRRSPHAPEATDGPR